MTRGVRRRVVAADSRTELSLGGRRITINVLTLACGHVVERRNNRPTRCWCTECLRDGRNEGDIT